MHNQPAPVVEKRRRRWPLIVIIIVALLAGGGVTGYWLTIGKPEFAAPEASPSPERSAVPVLAPIGLGGSAAATRMREALDPLINGSELGQNVNASVVDLRTGTVVYDHRGNAVRTPASNAKIITAAAVLATRGAGYRITTKAYAGAAPGEVVLVAAGDVTLAGGNEGYYAGAGRLSDLADQIKKNLGGVAPTKVILDTSLYTGQLLGPGWDPDEHEQGYTSKILPIMIDGGRSDLRQKIMPFTRYAEPDLAAGRALARRLGVPEEAVTKGTVVTGAAELGAVQSAPMLRQLEQMLAESDNTLAEALARQVALSRNKPASFEGGAAATQEVLVELGLPADQAHLVDGAGYSRQNQVSPAVFTGLLRLAADGKHPKIGDVINALPVAGWSGSMATRFAENDALNGRGVVRAKSGTLNGINAISGVVQTMDGGLYAFSVLANQVPVGQYPAQEALDRIVARIAACGCG